jgi:hypothetical protein
VQAGAARAALAVFIQLVDQSIAAIGTALAQAGTPVHLKSLALPAWWFTTHPPAGVRGVDQPGQAVGFGRPAALDRHVDRPRTGTTRRWSFVSVDFAAPQPARPPAQSGHSPRAVAALSVQACCTRT